MKIVADENIALLNEYFGRHGEVMALSGRKISITDIADADVLLVRSVTSVNQLLLKESSIKFVGSCTIGIDHLDTQWLEQNNIAWAYAPGSNANAVVDYVIACLFALGLEVVSSTENPLMVGIVGCGNVGARLRQRLLNLGVRILCCDPFLSNASEASVQYLPLSEIIPQCDVLCLHTPLTNAGLYPTFHLINEQNLSLFKKDAVLLNAGRGAVIDNLALLHHLNAHMNFRAVLDVWENEPAISRSLLEKISIATPHVAGYSVEGKQRGTEMVYLEFCKAFGITPVLPKQQKIINPIERKNYASLKDYVLAAYNPLKDSEQLKKTLFLNDLERANKFDELRKNYSHRREFVGC